VATRPLEIWRKLFGPTLLHNQAAELTISGEKLLVYGAPYGASDFERVPDGTAVLITHEPPFTILDRRIGSMEVAEATRARQPRLHLFGHVHAQGGGSEAHGATLHVNAATRAVLIDVGDAASVSRVIRPRV
jgi:Icc-related predicted phosphoesterase